MIRPILLLIFINFYSSIFAQPQNPVHWVIGINAGGEYLYPNTETNPVGITYGVFQQFSIKDFSVAAGVTFGQRNIYDQLVNQVRTSSFNFTSTRVRKYQEESLTLDLFIKYYPSFLQKIFPKKGYLFFVGAGIQLKSPMETIGESVSTNTSNFFSNSTVAVNGVDNKKGYRFGIGMDHLINEKTFISAKFGLNFFVDQLDSRVNPKNLSYTGGNNNLFFEIQIGYNFKKSYSLFRG